ncbi:hypothetical protein [Yinghuangia aomiensis]|uniref:hypothetical protein n=1 Tax=Yinghuangia aomiensis TaxID=676205 RepID=UPI0031EE740F
MESPAAVNEGIHSTAGPLATVLRLSAQAVQFGAHDWQHSRRMPGPWSRFAAFRATPGIIMGRIRISGTFMEFRHDPTNPTG